MTRPDSSEWTAGKAAGDRAELAVAKWFSKRGFALHKTLGLAGYDLLVQAHVEVKNDLQTATTGNVAVEIAYKGDPSGINKTDATFWVYALGSEAVIVQTEKLREFVLTGDFPEVAGGDNCTSTLRLVPLEQFKSIEGARVIELTEEWEAGK